MKLIKTASNVEVTMSEREWTLIGQKAGWLKSAQVMPPVVPPQQPPEPPQNPAQLPPAEKPIVCNDHHCQNTSATHDMEKCAHCDQMYCDKHIKIYETHGGAKMIWLCHDCKQEASYRPNPEEEYWDRRIDEHRDSQFE